MVTNLPAGKSLARTRLSRFNTSAGWEQGSAKERRMPRVADINKAAAAPFPATSARTSPQEPPSKGKKSYQSPPTARGGTLQPAAPNSAMEVGLVGHRGC